MLFLHQVPSNARISKNEHVAMYDLFYTCIREVFNKNKRLVNSLQLLSSFHSTWEAFARCICPSTLEAVEKAFKSDLDSVFKKVMSLSPFDCEKVESPDYNFPKYMVKLPFKFDGCMLTIIQSGNPIYYKSFIENMDILNKDLFAQKLDGSDFESNDKSPEEFASCIAHKEPEEMYPEDDYFKTSEDLNLKAIIKFYQDYQKYENLRYTRDLRNLTPTVIDGESIYEQRTRNIMPFLMEFYNDVFNRCSEHLSKLVMWANTENPSAITEVPLPQIETSDTSVQALKGGVETSKAMAIMEPDGRFYKPNKINSYLLHCLKDEVSTCWLVAQLLIKSKLSIMPL